MLNELECVGDHVYANVWQTDEIVRIDLATGRVDAVVDASGCCRPTSGGRRTYSTESPRYPAPTPS